MGSHLPTELNLRTVYSRYGVPVACLATDVILILEPQGSACTVVDSARLLITGAEGHVIQPDKCYSDIAQNLFRVLPYLAKTSWDSC